jgi:hypothetical protein
LTRPISAVPNPKQRPVSAKPLPLVKATSDYSFVKNGSKSKFPISKKSEYNSSMKMTLSLNQKLEIIE